MALIYPKISSKDGAVLQTVPTIESNAKQMKKEVVFI
jgi:hypothetical protein